MFLKNLNKNVNEETGCIHSLSLTRYLLIYIPLLFIVFAVTQLMGGFFLNHPFNWEGVLIKAILFAVFFKVFHYVRKKVNKSFKNKHN